MIAASFSSLDTGILLLERRDLGIDGKSNDTLGSLVSRDTPEKLEPGRVVIGIKDSVRALLITNCLIQRKGDLSLIAAGPQEFASALASGMEHSRLGASVELIVITIVHSGVPFKMRHRAFDFRLHLQLTKDVQSEIIAAYRHLVAGRWKGQFRRVIE